jgi:hypothetical protein
MTPTCPCCGAEQSQSLTCANCVLRIEQLLAEVAALHDELYVAISRQAKLGNTSSGGSLARERTPVNFGASTAATNLTDTLASWARDVSGDQWRPTHGRPVMVQAAWLLLGSIDTIRRHPAVEELVAEIGEAVSEAWRIIDRAPDRVYVGPCWESVLDEYDNTVTCTQSLYARPGVEEVRCRTCAAVHSIADRRAWLIDQAADLVVTAREAARYVTKVGNLEVTEANIRNWVGRGKVKLRPGLSTQRQFELGALLDYIATRHANSQRDGVAPLPVAV